MPSVPAEMDAIKKKFANSGMDTLSGFVRAMIFEGYIVHIDEDELQNKSSAQTEGFYSVIQR